MIDHDRNVNKSSLTPTGSTGIVKVGNSIDITKKLISQGERSILGLNKISFIPYRKNDKWYLYDFNLKHIIDIEFDYIYLRYDNYKFDPFCILKKDLQAAFCGKSFNYLDLTWVDEITFPAYFRNILIVREENKYKIKNEYFFDILPTFFDYIVELGVNIANRESSIYLTIYKNGKVGLFCCKSLSIVLPIAYDEIRQLENVEYFSVGSNSKKGIYSSAENKIIVDPIFENIKGIEKNICFVVQNGKLRLFGILNKRFLNESNYTLINLSDKIIFEEGYFFVNKDWKRYLVNENGVEQYIGEFKKVKRYGSWFLCSNDLMVVYIYNLTKLVTTIYRDWQYIYLPDFKVIDNLYFEFSYDQSLGNFSYYKVVIGYYDIMGNKIGSDFIAKYEENKSSTTTTFNNKGKFDVISICDTFWSIQEDGLYFKDNLIYKSEFFKSSRFEVSDFNLGLAYVQEVNFCDEDNWYWDEIGYIDVYGNFYWETNNI